MFGYTAAGNRCALYLPSLSMPKDQVLHRLEKLGFIIEHPDVVSIARALIGKVTYQRGASYELAPHTVDCSGFIKWLYAQRGIWLPRRSMQQWRMGIAVAREELCAGDLVFSKGIQPYRLSDGTLIGHVGMMTDNAHVIHATHHENGVGEVSFEEFDRRRHITGFRRIIVQDNDVLTLTMPPNYKIEVEEDIRLLIQDMLVASQTSEAAA